MEPTSGRLAACEFRGACDALAAAWRRHGGAGEWRWHDAPPSPLRASAAARTAPGWLQLEEHLVRAAPPAGPEEAAFVAVSPAPRLAENDDEDDAVALPLAPVTWHRYTLAVAFHDAYAVPWLLLRAAQPGGQPLTWRQVLADLAPRMGAAAAVPPPDAAPLAGALGALTPCEHPLTGEPWFGLHPCTTADVMALLLAADDPDAPPKRDGGDDDAAAASRAAATPDAADDARLGRYMRAWWSVAGGSVGASLNAAAYAPPSAAQQAATVPTHPPAM